MQRRYRVLDVFAERAPAGNPLAVVIDGEDLDTDQMQAYANWTNLSETTFLLPPTDEGAAAGADYRVRIFTPGEELPFAGHPTLGSCRAWLDAGGRPTTPGRVVQECGVGLVPIQVDDTGQAFRAPGLLRSGPVEPATLSTVLGQLGLGPDDIVDSAWIDNGPGWLGLLLADAASVLAVRPGQLSEKVGLIGFYPEGQAPEPGAAYEVRAFFDTGGQTAEDPVTGSLNASAAQWLLASRRVSAPYRAIQGTAIGRSGRVDISVDDDGEVWVGGGAVVVVSGTVEL
ncbi:MAG: PhzF family phenazine biosynthesis protein [Actinomycetota bacterium]